jgi:hypothetical protein
MELVNCRKWRRFMAAFLSMFLLVLLRAAKRSLAATEWAAVAARAVAVRQT